jgi:omega-6 fatty acid desaturase (delta-12 desaturase)
MIGSQEQTTSPPTNTRIAPPWAETIAKYKHANTLVSLWQIVNTLVPLGLLAWLMYVSYAWSYALSLALAIPTAALLVRVFILQHDCGHHSFFRSERANDLFGYFCSVLTLTPYHWWRRTHARHHVTSGNLAHRSYGDVMTLTVDEYLALSRWGRLRYRLYRQPLFMFGLGASYFFLVRQRFTTGLPRTWRRERWSVHVTNLGLAFLFGAAGLTIGLTTFVALWLPVIVLAAAAGSWLFYVQHQYEEAYWEHDQAWNFTRAALEGSSYLRLPRMLQWLTGNIGYHHIHHLNSRIPNYHLPACYAAEPAFREAPTIGLADTWKCMSLKLWDPHQRRLVTFAEAHARQAA